MLHVLRASVGRLHVPGCNWSKNIVFLFSDIARVHRYWPFFGDTSYRASV